MKMTAATRQLPARNLTVSRQTPTDALLAGWHIYARDGALLAMFMLSACASVIVIEHPRSPVSSLVESDFLRRAMVGLAMGLTAVGLIYSPWGKRTGALMNPAMTLCFWRLGRIRTVDWVGYTVAQFAGGAMGVAIAAMMLGPLVRHPSVNFVATLPGPFGLFVAWIGEFVVALILISVVLTVNKIPALAMRTGFFAAGLVALFIAVEAPLSGMSLNPARTFGSSLAADLWTGWWIYLTAPPIGMLAGVELQRRLTRGHQRLCGKLVHSRTTACFIRCNCVS